MVLNINQDNIALPNKAEALTEDARIVCALYFNLNVNSVLELQAEAKLTERGRDALETLVFSKVITMKTVKNKAVYKGTQLSYDIGRAVRGDPDFLAKSQAFKLVGSSILNRRNKV